MNSKSKNDKNIKFFKTFLPIVFGILIFLLLDFFEIYKKLHLIRGNVFVQPSSKSLYILYGITILNIIVVLLMYNRIVVKKYDVAELLKKKKGILCFFIITNIILSIFALSGYSYIKNDDYVLYEKNFTNKEYIASREEIEKVNIYVEQLPFSPTGATIYDEYVIVCRLNYNNKQITIDSSCFRDYDCFFNYINGFNHTKVYVNDDGLEDLIKFEKNKPLNSSKKSNHNIETINKIFSL
ncbi:MAG: hypothetical protein IJ643_00620 [Eubacterium sp.]|nr:hypothetical protein [Eubacterium sp.]